MSLSLRKIPWNGDCYYKVGFGDYYIRCDDKALSESYFAKYKWFLLCLLLIIMLTFPCDFVRCYPDKQSWFPLKLRVLDWANTRRFPCTLSVQKLMMSNQRLAYLSIDSNRKQHRSPIVCKTYAIHAGLEESSSLQSEDPFTEDEHTSEDSPEQLLAKPLSSEEVNLYNYL